MLYRLAFEIKVLGIDRLLVKELVKLCSQVLEPVVPVAHSRRAGRLKLATF